MANPAPTRHPATGSDEHPVLALAAAVDSTHPGLGNLAAISVVAAKSRECLMVVGFAGTGKSVIARWLVESLPDASLRNDLTMVRLASFNEELSDSEQCLVVEDMGECNNDWTRTQTAVGLSALTYSHQMTKDTAKCKVRIENFFGSCWLGVQPAILKEIVVDNTWQANLKDKSLRYYHLQRPLTPNFDEIKVPIEWGEPLDNVLAYDDDSPAHQELVRVGRVQWSFARASQHIGHLLKGCAALRGSYSVDESDVECLYVLLRPMVIEREIISKSGFDSGTKLDNNLLALLTEFATYPALTYDIIASDYGMRPRQVLGVLEHMWEWYYKVGDNPPTLAASDQLKSLLQEAGIR